MRGRRARFLRKLAVVKSAQSGQPTTPIYRAFKRRWTKMPKLQDRGADRGRPVWTPTAAKKATNSLREQDAPST